MAIDTVTLVLTKGYSYSDSYRFKATSPQALNMVKILASGTNVKLTPSIIEGYLNIETYNGTPIADALKPLIVKIMERSNIIAYEFKSV